LIQRRSRFATVPHAHHRAIGLPSVEKLLIGVSLREQAPLHHRSARPAMGRLRTRAAGPRFPTTLSGWTRRLATGRPRRIVGFAAEARNWISDSGPIAFKPTCAPTGVTASRAILLSAVTSSGYSTFSLFVSGWATPDPSARLLYTFTTPSRLDANTSDSSSTQAGARSRLAASRSTWTTIGPSRRSPAFLSHRIALSGVAVSPSCLS